MRSTFRPIFDPPFSSHPSLDMAERAKRVLSPSVEVSLLLLLHAKAPPIVGYSPANKKKDNGSSNGRREATAAAAPLFAVFARKKKKTKRERERAKRFCCWHGLYIHLSMNLEKKTRAVRDRNKSPRQLTNMQTHSSPDCIENE